MSDVKPLRLSVTGETEQFQSGDTLAVSNGGTGSATASGARINIGSGFIVDYNNTPVSGTNTTNTELLHSLSVPSGLILPNDIIRVHMKCTNNNSVGSKAFSIWINSTSSIATATQLATIGSNTSNTFLGGIRDLTILSDTTIRVSSGATVNQNAETGTTTITPNTITVPSLTAGVFIIIAGKKSNGADTDTIDTSFTTLMRK